ncbi:SAM-dependent methyltransferase, partial [Acinetobacter baumannii]
MKVYFVGAGPGAADLITLRGARLLGQVRMVLYAGSLVPTALLEHCHPEAEIIDTAALDL